MGVCDIDRMGIDDCDNVAGVDVDGAVDVGKVVPVVVDVADISVVVVVVVAVRIGGARRRAVRHEPHDVRKTRR